MKKLGSLILVLWLCFPISVYAGEIQDNTQEELLSKFDFEEINELLSDIFGKQKLNFKDTVINMINGDTEVSFEALKELLLNQFVYEIQSSKSSIIHILVIAIIAAVFHNFSGIFQNNQVAELSFYVLYMLLITISLESFRILIVSVVSGIENLLQFLQVLGPVYFMAVAIASGSTTSIAFYNIILILIYIVQTLILTIMIPVVNIYMVVRILNDLSSEELLSKLGDLIQTVISWSLKTLIAGIVGINVIQGMLSPAIDSVKRSILTRGGEAIPVIGNAVGGVAEVVLGTAVLIKNGIGVTGAVICVAICLGPVIKMGVVALMYKVTAALMQPISDKRIVGFITSMADGAVILMKIILSSCVLFLISIAMVAATTS